MFRNTIFVNAKFLIQFYISLNMLMFKNSHNSINHNSLSSSSTSSNNNPFSPFNLQVHILYNVIFEFNIEIYEFKC